MLIWGKDNIKYKYEICTHKFHRWQQIFICKWTLLQKWKCWHIQRIWHFSMYHVIQKTCSINHWKMNGCYGCKHQITENKITRLMIQISSIFLPNTWHLLSYNISDFHSHNIQCNAIHIVPFLPTCSIWWDSHLIVI